MKEFKILKISKEQKDSLEQLGTKEKFWFIEDGVKKLFKIGRPNTGEDWVEVVVSEICEILDIPHAKYDFACYEDKIGTVTTNIVPLGGRLIHGNELLAKVYKKFDLEYEQDTFYKVRKHMLPLIALLMKNLKPAFDTDKHGHFPNAFGMFIGYIILDCLISNQDRHHENWGIILYGEEIFLAPTYDHASGLGSKEQDAVKKNRLYTNDNNFTVDAFVAKAKTAFYDRGKILKTIDSVKICGKEDKDSTLYWLKKIENIDIKDIMRIFEKIPKDLISEISVEFALEMIKKNKKRLVDYKKDLENE